MVNFAPDDGNMVCSFEGQLTDEATAKIAKEVFDHVYTSNLPVVFDLEKADSVEKEFMMLCLRIQQMMPGRFSVINPNTIIKNAFTKVGFERVLKL